MRERYKFDRKTHCMCCNAIEVKGISACQAQSNALFKNREFEIQKYNLQLLCLVYKNLLHEFC